jgi:hypothetical protein
MAGRKVTAEEIDDSQVEEWAQSLAVAKAEVRKCELVLKHYAETHGGFSAAGLHFYNTQSMKETYDTGLVGDATEDLEIPRRELLRFMPTAAINKLVRASEYGPDIRAILKQAPNEGMIVTYGKPILAARTSAPDEAKVRILQPGDAPLEAEPLEQEDRTWGDDEDDGEYTEAPLSTGLTPGD